MSEKPKGHLNRTLNPPIYGGFSKPEAVQIPSFVGVGASSANLILLKHPLNQGSEISVQKLVFRLLQFFNSLHDMSGKHE
jgi:hypothetical protein